MFKNHKINNKKFSPIIFIKNNNCMKCHNIVKGNSIPSFKEISEKYKNKKNYKNYLYKKIKLGIKNNRSLIMPSFKNIKKKSLLLISKWILKMKKIKL